MTTLRLGDVVTVSRGTTYKSALIGLPGPVLLGLGSIQRNGGFRGDALRTYGGDSPEKIQVQPGQLYASLKDVTQSADLLGAVAKLPLDHPPGRLTQDTVRLDPVDADFPLDYLYWVLQTPQYRQYCRAHLTGTTNLGLPRGDFFAFEFPAPNSHLLELTATLGALDDKIESNRRAISVGESLIRAHVESALDTSRGEGGTLGDYCTLVKAPVKVESIRSDDIYIGLEHMPRGSIFLTDWERAEGLGSNKTAFSRGDVLFGKLRPYFKKVGIASVDGVCSTDILVVRPKSPRDLGLVAAVSASDALIDSLTAGSTGTRMPRASWKDLAAWPVPVLSVTERTGLAGLVDPLIHRLEQLTSESRRLAAMRDALVPEVLSGRVRAPVEGIMA